MYYLNGRIDYNEIVTMPRRTTEPPPAPCYDDGMDQCAMFMKCVMYTYVDVYCIHAGAHHQRFYSVSTSTYLPAQV